MKSTQITAELVEDLRNVTESLLRETRGTCWKTRRGRGRRRSREIDRPDFAGGFAGGDSLARGEFGDESALR